MPGSKSLYENNYITTPVVYRSGIAISDTEPPTDKQLSTINFPEDLTCRLGANNHLFIYLVVDGPVIDITAKLWRMLDVPNFGVLAFDSTPATWVAVNQSSLLYAGSLPAGAYVVTVAGAFHGTTVCLVEQHSE